MRTDHGVEVEVLPADLRSASARARRKPAVRLARLDLLVNTAGIGHSARSTAPYDELREIDLMSAARG